MRDVEWILLYVFLVIRDINLPRVRDGRSGVSLFLFFSFFFKGSRFMLFLAFSGSGGTGEFCLLAFDINCRLHQVLSLSICLSLLSRSDFTFFPSLFILFYSLWILSFMPGPLHNQHFA